MLRQELYIGDNELLVGTVARIAAQHKDLPTFYQVAAEVCKRMPNVKFVIVGDGHGETGFLSPIRDIKSMSNQVVALLEDADRRTQFGQNARKRIEKDF
ncbi:MAG: hypothetical protein U9R57_15590, partial [Thermodesulfobacteriota bacterium]|nr:hypothetical protein [Thermodesulfobacteriota bacterium]